MHCVLEDERTLYILRNAETGRRKDLILTRFSDYFKEETISDILRKSFQ